MYNIVDIVLVEEICNMFIFHQHVDVDVSDVPVPNITVYRQMEEREHDSVIVLCIFDRMLRRRDSWQMQSFELSVESELNYTKEKLKCTSSDRKMCVFMVTVSPPASFTCVHEIPSNGEVKSLSSETYSYKRSGKTNTSLLGHLYVTSLHYTILACLHCEL